MAEEPSGNMTEEEEAQLLAEYGSFNPFYDDLLDVQAPSQYRSVYGTSNLFLTGVEEGTASKATEDPDLPHLSAIDFTAPVELFLMRNLDTNVRRPASYVEALDLAVDSLNHLHQHQSREKDTIDPTVFANKNLLHEADRLALGISDGGDDDSDVDCMLQGLIREAQAEIDRKNFHYDPENDPEFQERLRMLQERDLTPLNDEAFEDDEGLLSAEELREIVDQVDQRPSAPVLLPEEADANAAAAQAESTAYDIRQRKQAILKRNLADTTEREEQIRGEITSFVAKNAAESEPQVISLSDVLRQIETIEQRDILLNETAMRNVEVAAQTNAATTASDYHSTKREAMSSRGLLALDDFNKKIDKLIAPDDDSAVLPSEVPNATTVMEGTSVSKKIKPAPEKVSIAEIKKRASRQALQARVEATEKRLMREEDDRVAFLIRQAEMAERDRVDRLTSLFSREDTGRRTVCGEEAVAHVEIMVREERQRKALSQLLLEKRMRQNATMVSELTSHHQNTYDSVVNLEQCEWGAICSSEKSERDSIIASLAAVEEYLRKIERQLVTQRDEERAAKWDATVQRARYTTLTNVKQILSFDDNGSPFPNTTEVQAAQQRLMVSVCGFGARSDQVLQSLQYKQHWCSESKNDCVAAMQAISGALHSSVQSRAAALRRKKSSRAMLSSTPSSSVTVTPSPPPSREQPLELEGGVTLNDKLIRRLHPLHFAAALSELSRAPQVFRSLAAALESIEHIDYASLSDMCVAERTSSTSMASFVEAESVKIAAFVRSLDISSNSLNMVQMETLLDTYPGLRSLMLCHNQLTALPIKSRSANSSTFSSLTSIDVSANQLQDASALTLFPELRKIFIFSNQLKSLDFLSNCSHLRELEMSRNSVSSCSGLEGLSTLGTLDLGRNQLTTFDGVKANVILQKLFLSSNRIASFPVHLPLVCLRQLYLNENQLTEVPSELQWLPMLSDLHLESNLIQSISGLRGCLQLTTLKLAFNKLAFGVDDLRPIAACKRLRILSYNDNPFMLIPFASAEAERFVLNCFPLLTEVNLESVKEPKRQAAAEDFDFVEAPFFTAILLGKRRLNRRVTHREVIRQASHFTAMCNVRNIVADANDQTLSPQLYSSKVRLGYAQDVLLDRLQCEYDSQSIYAHRRLQNAISFEENVKSRTKERGGYVLSALFTQSDTIAERNYIDSMQQTQRHLEALREQVSFESHTNVHSVSSLYEQRARAYRESQARQKISQWVLGRCLIRKAVAELEVLREASVIGRTRRLTKAALIIQPLWRGAIVRRRLRKARVKMDDDDDELFQKVTFHEPEGPVGFSNFTALFQGALLSHPQAQPFQVKLLQPSNKSNPAIHSERLGSAPAPPPASYNEALGGRPQSNPLQAKSTRLESDQSATSGPATARGNTLDDEWGSALAEQLRKKNKKMEKAKQDMIRREFMNDPLNAKKLMNGAKQ